MNERGQVFTLDMFFALALVTLIIGCSGLALEQVRRQMDDYLLRYSLEQTANFAADMLVKTGGIPDNWWMEPASVETVGLSQANPDGDSIPNSLSIQKLENLRQLCRNEIWEGYPETSQAIKNLFNNSEKFEIVLIDEKTGENIWPPVYPRWDIKSSSGAKDSSEVVIVKRLVATSVITENSIENLVHISKPPRYQVYFTVNPGELNTRDWYIVLTRLLPRPPTQPEIRIWVNRNPPDGDGDWDFKSPPRESPFRIRSAGVDYPDGSDYLFPVPLHEGLNFIWIRVSGKYAPADVSIVSLPRGSPTKLVELPPTGTLVVKLWR
ncbi:MAG: hypothetical protein ACP5PX_05235 [Candidatus Hadarchaeum sp.]|uniref:hypothetical protein n=1 Tax=Candidatus Hadarchaeum sp. TaxID=2883567 RepID=UPI003D0BC7F0